MEKKTFKEGLKFGLGFFVAQVAISATIAVAVITGLVIVGLLVK